MNNTMKKSMTTPRLQRARGAALVTAIFLLVVLAGLGVAVVSLTTTQQASATQDELGARARLAAKAGLEWALYRQLVTNNLACPATFALPAATQGGPGNTLSGFTVTITCTVAPPGFGVATGADPTAGHFTITSTACNGPLNGQCPAPSTSPDYVQRVVMARL